MVLGLLLVVLALPVAAFRSRPSRALAILLATIVLVPGTLPFPGLPGALTVHRVVELAALLNVLRRIRRRQVPVGVLQVPPVGRRLALLLGVLAVLGVALLEPPSDAGSASRAWEAFVFQGVLLLVVLALLRCCESVPDALVPLALAMTVSAVLAALEHATGSSYARAWFRMAPELLATDPAQVLATRAGHVRVRAAADFTLAFAWGLGACLPLVLVLAARARGRVRAVLLVSVPLMLLAVLWTYTRSVVAPMALAVVLTAVALRDRVVRIGVAAGAAGLGLVVLASAGLQRDFSVAVDRGSIDVRIDRLPVVLDIASGHPYRGVGLAGLAERGVPGTDSSYELLYAEVGAIGVAVFVGVLLAALLAALRPLLSRDHDDRVLGLATGLGAAMLAGSAAVFDVFTTPSSAELFWVLVAAGVVAAERSRSLLALPPPSAYSAGLVLAGLLLVGLGLRSTATTHVAQTWQFETLGVATNTLEAPTFTGLQLQTTACEVLRLKLTGSSGRGLDCRGSEPARGGESGQAPGQAQLRLEADNGFELRRLTTRAVEAIREVPTLDAVTLVPEGPATTGTPSALRTAPAALLALGVVLLVPVGGRRR